MIYKTPFLSFTKALYKGLKLLNDLEWFDSSVSIDEIEEEFAKQREFAYGIFGSSTVDCVANKDLVIWEGSINLEIYSNYKGRKVVAEKLENLLNAFNRDDCWNTMQLSLNEDGYAIESISVGSMSIENPIYGENGMWQSGSTMITFKLTQI